MFPFIGAQAAYEAGVSSLFVVLMGAITGVAGGVMHNVLCNEVPLIPALRGYATAAIQFDVAVPSFKPGDMD